MQPKFSVGEVVVLQSVELPERNGEYTVSAVWIPPGHIVVDSFPYRVTDVTYRLEGADEPIPHGVHKGPALWNESALRKKHIPGEFGFTDLMASLSSPKLLTHQT
jgi:hypothetical protein